MTILFCGKFNPDYNRTRIIIEGLRQLGTEVLLYPYPRKRQVNKPELKKFISRSDLLFLPSFTHTDVPFIRRMTSKPILFDPLISRYLSKVYDYQSISRYSPRAYKNYLKDSRSLAAADLILADTQAHKNYYSRYYKTDPAKIKVVPVGVISEDYYPISTGKKPGNKLKVGFYGSFIPLHGIDIILKAAEILKDDKDIYFSLIGDGILMKEMKELSQKMKLKNLEFPGWINYENLNKEINTFDIALGIFGSSIKAKMVIPNKIFHYAACEKAIISMESDAIREIFTNQENILLSDNSPQALANAILSLKSENLRKKIAENAHKIVIDEYNEKKTATQILEFVNPYLSGIGL